MFAVHCPRHGGRVLLDVRRITRITNLADGAIAVELRCYDGEPLVVLSGRRAIGAAAPVPADPAPGGPAARVRRVGALLRRLDAALARLYPAAMVRY